MSSEQTAYLKASKGHYIQNMQQIALLFMIKSTKSYFEYT